ncbi:hypothetical protein N7523_008155 [Penicillium sp. IBT 18751x]|nr:hypothetical protein N7523_008155 [Penicillium sp. IBT 18751x]
MTKQEPVTAPPPYTPTDTTNETTTTPVNGNPRKIPSIEQYWYKNGIFGLHSRATLRVLQFIFAIIVAGLYGVDLARATKRNAPAPAQWVYAEMIVVFSAVTCAVHAIVTVKHVLWCLWDGVLCVFWLAQVGVFGSIYYASPIDAEYEDLTQCVPRMKAAVWIDVVNLLLWLLTFVLGVAWCIRTRKITRRTDKLGRIEDVEGMGEQETGYQALKQGGSESSEVGVAHETLDEKRDEKGDFHDKDEK